MKHYATPELLLIFLAVDDVITSSFDNQMDNDGSDVIYDDKWLN